MNFLTAAKQALEELKRLHDIVEPCDNPNCPARKAIQNLASAMAENEGSGLVVWDEKACDEAIATGTQQPIIPNCAP